MKILVIDDAIEQRALLELCLRRDGHEVLSAASGRQGVAMFAQHDPDLVLVDVLMPDLDGHAAVREIRSSCDAWVPIVFVSGSEDPDDIAKAFDAGGDGYLPKPIRPDVLQANIRSMQRLVAMRRQLIERSEQLSTAVEAVTRLSELDELTGVFNRRGLDRKLGEEWGRAMRTGNPLSIILLDVDHFKQFNDEHGHLAGDQCLRNISDCLRMHVRRPADAVARFGGEEFCVVLPETSAEGGWTIAELLRTEISKVQTATRDGAAFVTASLGVASVVPTETMQITDALASADLALYQAKADGRNAVRCAPAQPGTKLQ